MFVLKLVLISSACDAYLILLRRVTHRLFLSPLANMVRFPKLTAKLPINMEDSRAVAATRKTLSSISPRVVCYVGSSS